jgi:hypothetical protein
MWGAIDEYGEHSPGEQLVGYFFRLTGAKAGESVIDIGAGAGAGSLALKKRGLIVRAFDLTNEAWRHPDIPLLTGSIWRDLPSFSPPCDYGYCCDVMEHIPTEFTALSVSEILKTCGKAFFSISFRQDNCGAFIGETLHMTVKPYTWWRDLMREVGEIVEARDLMGDGVFVVSR